MKNYKKITDYDKGNYLTMPALVCLYRPCAKTETTKTLITNDTKSAMQASIKK